MVEAKQSRNAYNYPITPVEIDITLLGYKRVRVRRRLGVISLALRVSAPAKSLILGQTLSPLNYY